MSAGISKPIAQSLEHGRPLESRPRLTKANGKTIFIDWLSHIATGSLTDTLMAANLMPTTSALEDEMLVQIRNSGLPEPEREVQFHPTRRWRLDFFWRCPIHYHDLALEVEGGTYARFSRHTSKKGFEGDCEKYNEVALANIVLLRVTSKHVRNGDALEWVKRGIERWEMESSGVVMRQ